jgi:hypothetical protein
MREWLEDRALLISTGIVVAFSALLAFGPVVW